MNISRVKPDASAATNRGDATVYASAINPDVKQLEDYLSSRDFTGALTLLTVGGPGIVTCENEKQLWIAYCAYHLGDYKRALEIYKKMSENATACDPDIHIYLGCCYYMLGSYPEAMQAVEKGSKSCLQNRLTLHLAKRLNFPMLRSQCLTQLTSSVEDQLSCAAFKMVDGEYKSAIAIYEKLLAACRTNVAIDVYLALCYHKCGFYDNSQAFLTRYLTHFPDSILAMNLRACNQFKLTEERLAELELTKIQGMMSPSCEFGRELIRHNMVVFADGFKSFQVLPPLLDTVPESRINLVISHLRRGDAAEAHLLLKDIKTSTTLEKALEANIHVLLFQKNATLDDFHQAVAGFHLVGNSSKEEETHLGAQCLASHFFLIKRFPQALACLDSIKIYHVNNDEFNYNYGQVKAVMGHYEEALEAFKRVRSDRYTSKHHYLSYLSRCYIKTGQPEMAFGLFNPLNDNSIENYILLSMVANDCFKMGFFFVAAKAFHILEKFTKSVETSKGKIAACIGVFKKIITQGEDKSKLPEVIAMLESCDIEANHVTSVMVKWWMTEFSMPHVH